MEALIGELTNRGHRVGSLKHTAEDVLLDTPGKDTWRHREAGSKATAILHENGAALFIDRHFTLNEAVAKLGAFDFFIVEGFKSLETLAKIIVLRDKGELVNFVDGLEIAIANVLGEELTLQCNIPIFSLEKVRELANLVESRAFPLLPGLNCRGCGYDDCKSLAKAILAGEADAERCIVYGSGGLSLKVNDEVLPMGAFVQNALRNVVLGFVRSLKGVEDPKKVELNFGVGEQDG